MKRRLLLLLSVFFAVIGVLTFASCKENPDVGGNLQAGEEAGDYYCEVGGEKCTLSLTQECGFTLDVGGAPITGSYTPNGEVLAMKYDGGEISATYFNDVVTLEFEGTSYRFLRDVNYTVTFETNGGSTVSPVSVRNGKKAEKPEPPTKDGEVFVGWYTDNNFKSAYAFNEPVSSDLKLYARFVAPMDPEYTVSFDVNGGEGSFDPVQTIGHKLFELPVPEREDGAEFVGWWVSQYGDPEKLTYQYKVEQTLEESVTLYAVWAGEAPVVSVGEKLIEWNSVGVGATYSLTVKNLSVTDGDPVVVTWTGAQTSYNFDFTRQDAGEYEISVQSNNKEGKAYYKNKVLAKVSVFKVEGSTLMFNKVENAEKYLLAIECGDAGHHPGPIEIDANNPASYDFSGCEMKNGKIGFTVTATATGYLSSVSDKFEFSRVLDQVSGIDVEPNSEQLRWSSVPNAATYHVTVKQGDSTLYEEDVVDGTSFPLKNLDSGLYEISITPKARGWNSPAASTYSYQKNTLAAPANVRSDVANSKIVWDTVKGAVRYEVQIGSHTKSVTENEIPFTEEFREAGVSEYTVIVRAIAQDSANNSLWTDVYSVRYGELGNELRYRDGVLSWDPVFGVSSYELKLNDGEGVAYDNVSSIDVKELFTAEGTYRFALRALYADTGEKTIYATVQIYKLSFDTQGADQNIGSLYLATGDKVTLPGSEDVSLFGFDLDGWYTDPDEDKGERYDDGVYLDQNNRTVYAHWNPKMFHIKLVVAPYGIETEEITAGVDAFYRRRVELPIPESSDPIKGFTGWYDSPTGEVSFTRADGVIASYTQGGDITLYAQWIDVLSFTAITDGNGTITAYQVSKSKDINLSDLSLIHIPQYYQERPVTQVIDFTECTSLEIVEIPDSIQLISVATTESAFTGCTKLREIRIYETDYNGPKYYSDVDGVLLYNNPGTNLLELKLYPIGRDAEVFDIPDGVQVLPSNAIWNINALRTLTIPASVTLIETQAIGYSSTSYADLETLTFKAAANGAAEQPLEIREGAFYTLRALKHLTLPSRLTDLNFYTMFGDTYPDSYSIFKPSQLETLDFVGDGGVYSVKDNGALYKDNGADGLELVFYPSNAETFELDPNTTSIGDDAVRDNTTITAIEIPAVVTNIGARAFYGTGEVATLTFKGEAGKLTIGEYAFYGCGDDLYSWDPVILDQLVLPVNLVRLGAHAFGDTKIKKVTLNSDAVIDDGAFADDYGDSEVTELVIGPNVKNINFRSVFGAKVTTITVDPDNPYYDSEDNVIYTKNYGELVWYNLSALGDGNFVLPDSVTRIGANTFKDMAALRSITIPASVTYIGQEAFSGCSGLANVIFKAPENGAERAELTIGNEAFYNCKSLVSITLPEGTTSLGSKMFTGCDKLTEVNLPASLEHIEPVYDYNQYSGKTSTQLGMFSDSYSNILAVLTVAEGGQHYSAKEDVLYSLRLDEKTQTYVEDEVLYRAPKSAHTSVTLPDTISYIWDRSFYSYSTTNPSTLTTLIFPETLAKRTDKEGNEVDGTLEIGDYAFYGNVSLKSVVLPQGVTVIGEDAFNSCPFTSFVVPKTVTSIRASAFRYCQELRTLTFEEGGTEPLRIEDVTEYSSYGFVYNCSRLRKVELPERTSYIGEAAFGLCELPDGVVIPTTVREIGESAFEQSKIPTVTFTKGSKLESIGYQAFYSSKLESIVIPASVRFIDNQAFANCESLKSFVVEDNSELETIGDANYGNIAPNVFSGCYNLAEVSFGENSKLRYIGQEMFAHCVSLKSIVIPLSVEEIGKNAFLISEYDVGKTGNPDDLGLTSITFEQKEDRLSKLHVVGQAFSGTQITEFRFPETENEIVLKDNVFLGCANLATVYISSKIYNLKNAFLGCTKITKIEVSADNPSYEIDAKQPFLRSKTNGDILLVFGAVTGRLEIEDGSVQIGASAFSGTEITEVYIPRSVMRIGDSAFKDCLSLQKVEFESGSSLNTIGLEAFSGCVALNDIDFTKTLQLNTLVADKNGYNSNTFAGCSSLTVLDFSNTRLTTIGSGTFDGCTELQTLRLPRTLTSISSRTSYSYYSESVLGHTKIASLDLSRTGLKELPMNFFKGSATLESVQFPNSLNTIGPFAFQGCTALTELDLSGNGGIQEIGNYAFESCTNLATLKLPTSLRTIRFAAFANDTLVTSVNLDFVEAIELKAFYNTGLTEVTLLGRVTKWGGGDDWSQSYSGWDWRAVSAREDNGIFAACKDLKKVTFSYTLTADCKFESYTFAHCDALDTITFEEGTQVATLGQYMFTYCSGLKSVTLPASINDLNYARAFQNCINMQMLDFSKTALTGLDNSLFSGCENLETIKLPHGLTSIDYYLFEDMTKLRSVEIPSSVTSIGNSAFENCTSLTSIDLPEGIKTIGSSAFEGSGITSIRLPASLSDSGSYYGALGTSIFEDCASLGSVTFAPGIDIQKIPSSAFKNCTSLTSITLPEGLTDIGANAFLNAGIVSLTLPSSLKVVGNLAFSGSKIMNAEIKGGQVMDSSYSYASVPKQLFEDCTALLTVTFAEGTTEIGESWFSGCSSLMRVTLPESAATLGKNAFANCTSLQDIDLQHVSSIGEGAFTGCETLFKSEQNWQDGVFYLGGQIVAFDEDRLKAANGIVNVKDGTGSIGNKTFSGAQELKKIVLPASVTSIGANAFENCVALTEADLSASSVTEIPASAFIGCTALTKFSFPKAIESIGSSAFNKTGLTEITIPATVSTLGSSAFADSSLESITFEDGALTALPSSLFSGCESLTSVKLGTKIIELNMYVFENCTALETIDLSHLEVIGSSAFRGAGLTSVTIPEAIKGSYPNNLGANAFENCTKLAKVEFASEENFTNLSGSLFKGCTALKTITLPASVTAINESTFENSGLQSIVIPESVVGIGANAFKGCAELTSVTLSKGLKNPPSYSSSVASGLCEGAFENCVKLASIDFTACTSLTELPSRLFTGCTLLNDITLPAGLTRIGMNCFEGTAFTEFTIPETVSAIGTGAFKGLSITTITLPAALVDYEEDYSYYDGYVWVDGFGEGVFENCTELTTVIFAEGCKLTELSANTFKGCSSLSEITLPDGLDQVCESAFKGCVALKHLKLPITVKYFGNDMFSGCSFDLLEIPSSKDTDYYERYFSEFVSVKVVSILDGCTELNEYLSTVANLPGLQKIILPKTIDRYDVDYKGIGPFDNLPSTVQLCFVGSEEEMKTNFGESEWEEFKATFPEDANVVYEYKENAD